MKKIIFAALMLALATGTQAMKVKFAVDMTDVTVNTTGMHITGDFQEAAGFAGGNWSSNSTSLIQEGATQIYSIVVDLPAFQKYEYKFLNGDQFYDAEFVPVESRVGYNFNDNRWIYVDSLAADTFFVGAIKFAANAPEGKNLIRLLVNMQNETVSGAGVHVGGSFQGWSYATSILYSFEASVYEAIYYVDPASTIEYKFANGNALATAETIAGACVNVNGNRTVQVNVDTVLSAVCFSSCDSCSGNTGIANSGNKVSARLYPNPTTAQSQLVLGSNVTTGATVSVTDLLGNKVNGYNYDNSALTLTRNQLSTGIYFVNIALPDRTRSTIKWVIE